MNPVERLRRVARLVKSLHIKILQVQPKSLFDARGGRTLYSASQTNKSNGFCCPQNNIPGFVLFLLINQQSDNQDPPSAGLELLPMCLGKCTK